MNLSPPLPWHQVPVGAVVVLYGVPRAVTVVNGVGPSTVYSESLPPLLVDPADYVQLVTLDDADAVATLAAAGLNPEPIEEINE